MGSLVRSLIRSDGPSHRSRPRPRARAALALAALLGTSGVISTAGVVGAPSAAADPGGTVRLVAGGEELVSSPGTVSTSGVLRLRENVLPYRVDAAGREFVVKATSARVEACGPMAIVTESWGPMLPSSRLEWRDLATGRGGVAQAPASVPIPIATGWLETSNEGTDRVDPSTGDRTRTSLAPYFYPRARACSATNSAVSDATGVWSDVGSVAFQRIYLPAPGETADVLAVGAGAVVYLVHNASAYRLVRQDAGAAPVVLRTGAYSPTLGAEAAATSSATFYAVGSPLSEVPVIRHPVGAGAGVAVPGVALTFPFDENSLAVVDGQVVFVSTVLDGAWVLTPTVSKLPARSGPGAVWLDQSAGRLAWADRRRVGGMQVYTRAAGAAGLGGEQRLGTSAWSSVAAGGRRTAWLDTAIFGPAPLVIDDQVGRQSVRINAFAPSWERTPLDITAHRLVLADWIDGHRQPGVLNLVDGAWTVLPERSVVAGDAAYFVDASLSRVVRRSLTDGAEKIVVDAAAAGAPAGAVITAVAVEGDLLVWVWSQSAPSQMGVRWQNLRTGGSGALPTPLAATLVSDVSVYGRYVAVLMPGASTATLRVYDSATNAVVLDDPAFNGWKPSLGPAGLSWISTDTAPMFAPLPDQHRAPLHEGNPIAPGVLVVGDGVWAGEWVFTEPVPNCAVRFADAAGVVVRELPCDARFRGVGEAVVAWDGRSQSGASLPGGVYSWTVLAGDGDGPALAQNGTTAISGAVRVVGLEGFVRAAYQDFLARTPGASEVAFQVDAIMRGLTTRARFLEALAASPEWLSRIVTQLYRDTLGRAPDPVGLATWVSWLQSGRFTVAQTAALFYASAEFYAGLGGGTPTSWVTTLYSAVLGRAPDPAGLAAWVGYTTNPAYGREWVAAAFYGSLESRMRRVTNLYAVLLGRAPDPGGLSLWAQEVERSGDLALAVSLAGSPEYALRAESR